MFDPYCRLLLIYVLGTLHLHFSDIKKGRNKHHLQLFGIVLLKASGPYLGVPSYTGGLDLMSYFCL